MVNNFWTHFLINYFTICFVQFSRGWYFSDLIEIKLWMFPELNKSIKCYKNISLWRFQIGISVRQFSWDYTPKCTDFLLLHAISHKSIWILEEKEIILNKYFVTNCSKIKERKKYFEVCDIFCFAWQTFNWIQFKTNVFCFF